FAFTNSDTDRSQLGSLYREHSMLTFESAEFAGANNIVEKLQALPFAKVAHTVQTLDAQPSHPGHPSLLVLVTGTLTVDEEGNSLKFSQAFHLVQEGTTYFVLNDVFRLVYVSYPHHHHLPTHPLS
ncbi:nuclear transport factor 2, partial [Melampsora americana]